MCDILRDIISYVAETTILCKGAHSEGARKTLEGAKEVLEGAHKVLEGAQKVVEVTKRWTPYDSV